MSLLSKPELVKLTVNVAQDYGLDPALVCSHVDVRTHWHSGFCVPSAISYLYNQNLSPLEMEHRSIQWGLMAISGEFARNEGYLGKLVDLLDPCVNLKEGCRILANLIGRQGYDDTLSTVKALLAWNLSANRELVSSVLLKLEGYRELLLRTPSDIHTFPHVGSSLPPEYSQSEDNLLLEVGASTHTRNLP